MPALRSRITTSGRNAAGARSLWRATGMTESDFGKPIVAIANSYTQFVPGHVHLKDLGDLVAESVRAVLGDGTEVVLPAVRARDLPLLAAVSGGRIDDPIAAPKRATPE